MKLQEALDFINEEAVGKEELKGKNDIARFAVSVKQMIMSKGFKPEQAQNILAKFLNDMNKSGWFDNMPDEVLIAVDGSNVLFTTVAENGKKRQTFTYSGVEDQAGEYKAPTNVVGRSNPQAQTTNSFERYGNLKAKVAR
jgi:hypothetical protein